MTKDIKAVITITGKREVEDNTITGVSIVVDSKGIAPLDISDLMMLASMADYISKSRSNNIQEKLLFIIRMSQEICNYALNRVYTKATVIKKEEGGDK